MIKSNGKRVVDIIFYNNVNRPSQRIRKGITSNNEIVYDNAKGNIYTKTSYDIRLSNTHNMNIGDGARYYINIQNKDYLITDIECDSPDVDITDNFVKYNKDGLYKVTFKYKSYTIVQDVNVQHISVSLA